LKPTSVKVRLRDYREQDVPTISKGAFVDFSRKWPANLNWFLPRRVDNLASKLTADDCALAVRIA